MDPRQLREQAARDANLRLARALVAVHPDPGDRPPHARPLAAAQLLGASVCATGLAVSVPPALGASPWATEAGFGAALLASGSLALVGLSGEARPWLGGALALVGTGLVLAATGLLPSADVVPWGLATAGAVVSWAAARRADALRTRWLREREHRAIALDLVAAQADEPSEPRHVAHL